MDRSLPLKLFIGHTFESATARGSYRLKSEQISVVCSNTKKWDEQNSMFAESFSSGMGWTNFAEVGASRRAHRHFPHSGGTR